MKLVNNSIKEIILILVMLFFIGCVTEDSHIDISEESTYENGYDEIPDKRGRVKYFFNSHGLYLYKYKPVYDDLGRVIEIHYGDRYTLDHKLKKMYSFVYHSEESKKMKIKKIGRFNTHGKLTDYIAPDYSKIVEPLSETEVLFPDKINFFTQLEGGEALILCAGMESSFELAGHGGGSSTLVSLDQVKYVNVAMFDASRDYKGGYAYGITKEFNDDGLPVIFYRGIVRDAQFIIEYYD